MELYDDVVDVTSWSALNVVGNKKSLLLSFSVQETSLFGIELSTEKVIVVVVVVSVRRVVEIRSSLSLSSFSALDVVEVNKANLVVVEVGARRT